MKKIKEALNGNRRDFMKKSALVGAGVAASTVVGGEAMASVTTDTVETRENKGYQLTQHVADYYKSAAS